MIPSAERLSKECDLKVTRPPSYRHGCGGASVVWTGRTPGGTFAAMTRPPPHPHDPRSLIYEAYRIEGLTVEDARTIFLDWALGLPAGTDAAAAARALLAHHAGQPDDHPMSILLTEAAAHTASGPGRRRGGRQHGRQNGRRG